MVRELIHDPMFLGIKSKPASKEDSSTARDLLDTLSAHRETCVGMAANMIGKTVSIIAFFDGMKITLMYNPEIISKAAPFETEESCLSLYQDSSFIWRTKTYTGFTAQIIQHETDHCNGILI